MRVGCQNIICQGLGGSDLVFMKQSWDQSDTRFRHIVQAYKAWTGIYVNQASGYKPMLLQQVSLERAFCWKMDNISEGSHP